MKNVYSLVVLFLGLMTLNACKKEGVVEEVDFSGEYFGEVNATGRHPYSTIKTNGFLETFGYYVDTTNFKCCDMVTRQPPFCPETYNLLKLEIFKHGEQFYLRNKIFYNSEDERRTFDFPMIIRNDSLIFDSELVGLESNEFTLADLNEGYPRNIKLLGFSMNISKEHFGKGHWVFISEWSRTSSGLGTVTCQSMEFSNFKFEVREL